MQRTNPHAIAMAGALATFRQRQAPVPAPPDPDVPRVHPVVYICRVCGQRHGPLVAIPGTKSYASQACIMREGGLAVVVFKTLCTDGMDQAQAQAVAADVLAERTLSPKQRKKARRNWRHA